MFLGVPGRRDRPQREPAELDLISIADAAVRKLAAAQGRTEHRRPVSGEFPASRNEIGVQMRLGCVSNLEAEPLGHLRVERRVAGRVDHERASIAEGDEIRLMPKSLVDNRIDRRACHNVHGLLMYSGRRPATAMYPRYGTARATR